MSSLQIYVLAEDRWALHEELGDIDEKAAIEKSERAFISSNVTAVKLIRETYDEEKEANSDVIVFQKSKNDAVMALDKQVKVAQPIPKKKKKKEEKLILPKSPKKRGFFGVLLMALKAMFGGGMSDDEDGEPPVKSVIENKVESDEQKTAGPLDVQHQDTDDGILSGGDEDVVGKGTIAVMNLVTACLTYLHRTNYHRLKGGQFSEYDRFGCCLFLAGAIHHLIEKNTLSEAVEKRIIEKCMALVTNDPKRAMKFAEEFEQYLVTARYQNMYQAGVEVMKRSIEGHHDGGPYLANALEKWNASANSKENDNLVFILFTDIVDTAGYIQEKGDTAGFDMIRVHDKIVRDAIDVHAGREVKHTVDGIMAAFPIAENAVRAAIDIQKAVEDQNGVDPEMNLRLCIGIDGGIPVIDGEDMHGTAVQLAAKLCNKAEEKQILISDIVYKACDEDVFDVTSLGMHKFGGFDEEKEVLRIELGVPSPAVPLPELPEGAIELDVLQPFEGEMPKKEAAKVLASIPELPTEESLTEKTDDPASENIEEKSAEPEEADSSHVFSGALPDDLQDFLSDVAGDSKTKENKDDESDKAEPSSLAGLGIDLDDIPDVPEELKQAMSEDG